MATISQTTASDSRYQGLIDSHKDYLTKLQAAFDKRCGEIGGEAKAKLSQVPEDDQEARKAILEEEQARLNQTLAELKQVVNRSNAELRKKLEEIENQSSASTLDLEAELAQLQNPKKTSNH
jgi:DNA anti-recombination protein RmuC